jgi:hypothetical protein
LPDGTKLSEDPWEAEFAEWLENDTLNIKDVGEAE